MNPTSNEISNILPPISPPPPQPFSPFKKPLLIFSAILLFILSAGSAFFLGKSQNNAKITSLSPSSTPIPITPSPSSIPSQDPTTSWKTYTNTKNNFSFNYPDTWIINTQEADEETNAKLIVSRDNYKIIIWSDLVGIGGQQNVVPSENITVAGLNLYKRDLGENKVYQTGSYEIGKTPGSPTFTYNNKIYDISFEYPLADKDSQKYNEYDNVFDQILQTFKFLESNQEKIISSEITASKCQIKIETTNREIFLNTSYTAIGPQSKCYQFVKNIWSPSGTFVAFQDLSGGIDSQIRVFALQQRDIQSHNLDVLGTSTIFDMIFLPNDKLVALSGFPDNMSSYRITIYDLPNLYKTYPNNLEKDVDLYTNLNQNKKLINLPNIEKEYHVMSVSNGKLRIHGTQGIDTPSLQEYSINTR